MSFARKITRQQISPVSEQKGVYLPKTEELKMAIGKIYFDWCNIDEYYVSTRTLYDGYYNLSVCALGYWLVKDGYWHEGDEFIIISVCDDVHYSFEDDRIYIVQNKCTIEQWIKIFTDRLCGKINEPVYYMNNFYQIREYQGYIWINSVCFLDWENPQEVAILLTIEQFLSVLNKHWQFLDKGYTAQTVQPEPLEVEFFYHYGTLKDLEWFWPDNCFELDEPYPEKEEMKRLCETERQKYLAECKKLSTQGGFSDKIYFFWYEDHFAPASREFLLPQKATDKNFRCSNGIYELACWLEDEITVKTPADNLCRWTERINQLITDAAPSATMRICETGRHHFIAEHQGYIYLSCVYIEEFKVMITLPQMANLLAQYQAFLQQPAKDPAHPPAPLTAEIFAEGDQAAKIFHTWQA